jgi:hypothetical protein
MNVNLADQQLIDFFIQNGHTRFFFYLTKTRLYDNIKLKKNYKNTPPCNNLGFSFFHKNKNINSDPFAIYNQYIILYIYVSLNSQFIYKKSFQCKINNQHKNNKIRVFLLLLLLYLLNYYF